MQSRWESLLETNLNIASGFIISLGVWTWLVQPLFDIKMRFIENLGITAIFTVSAIIRSYLWRRYFNKLLMRRLHGRASI